MNQLNSLEVLSIDEEGSAADVIHQWNDLLRHAEPLNSLYASPEWFQHLSATSPESACRALLLQAPSGDLLGLAPVRFQQVPLPYAIGNRVLATASLRGGFMLGGQPLLPDDPQLYADFFDLFFRRPDTCECLFFDSVSGQSYFWTFMQQHRSRSAPYDVYLPFGVRPWHWIRLFPTFDEYLASMGRKTRYNLRRTVSLAEKACGGNMRAERIDSVDDVSRLAESVARINQQSWQYRSLGRKLTPDSGLAARLRDLAQRGLLRAYILEMHGGPTAFVIGYQYAGVFYFAETGFDQNQAALSPGTVLLHEVMRDLHEHRRPEVLNFGIGDATYKRRFANCEGKDAAVLVMRKTMRNRLRRWSHSSLQNAVGLGKRLLGRSVTK
jgi:hypothetical protein